MVNGAHTVQWCRNVHLMRGIRMSCTSTPLTSCNSVVQTPASSLCPNRDAAESENQWQSSKWRNVDMVTISIILLKLFQVECLPAPLNNALMIIITMILCFVVAALRVLTLATWIFIFCHHWFDGPTKQSRIQTWSHHSHFLRTNILMNYALLKCKRYSSYIIVVDTNHPTTSIKFLCTKICTRRRWPKISDASPKPLWFSVPIDSLVHCTANHIFGSCACHTISETKRNKHTDITCLF